MNKKYSWLELAEFFSVGSFLFGVITTAITKQILFSLTPLIFVLFFNIINRQRDSYQPDKILEQYRQTQQLQEDLITFSDDYKYQKLELERLIEEAKRQKLELENKTQEYLLNTDINSLLTQLNNLKFNQDKLSNYVYSELDKYSQSLENNKSDFNSSYQNPITHSINLIGLTEYYPLQGLTQRLITEVQNSGCIDNIEQNKARKLDEDSTKSLKNISQRAEDLAQIVIKYHNDHQCSEEEAKKLSFELRQLAMAIRQSRSVYDLKLIYEVTERFTFQISRFQHREIHHCWDTFMKNEIRGKLNKCKKDKNIK